MTKIYSINATDEIIAGLKNGEIGIIPTDTIYGLVGLATIPGMREKLKALKGIMHKRELAVLVPSFERLNHIAVIDEDTLQMLTNSYESITVVAFRNHNCKDSQAFSSNEVVGIRITQNKWVQSLLTQVGPLFATSVNKTSEEPLSNKADLEKFGADFMVYDSKMDKEMNHIPSKIFDALKKQWIR